MNSQRLKYREALKKVLIASSIATVCTLASSMPSIWRQSPTDLLKFLGQISTGFFIGLLFFPLMSQLVYRLTEKNNNLKSGVAVSLSSLIIVAAITQILIMNLFPGSEIYREKLNEFAQLGSFGIIPSIVFYLVLGLMGIANCILGILIDISIINKLTKILDLS